MKAVDFIVELEDRVSFIEIKDFEHPRAPSENRKALIEDFQNERLDSDLVYKFRDSFLYEWACKRVDKPLDYWILIASEALTKADLGRRIDAVKRSLRCLHFQRSSGNGKSLRSVAFSISALGTSISLIIL